MKSFDTPDPTIERILALKALLAQLDKLPLPEKDRVEIFDRLRLTDTDVLLDIVGSNCIAIMLDKVVAESSPYLQ